MAQSSPIRWRFAELNEPLRQFLERGEWQHDAERVKQNNRRSVFRVEPAQTGVPSLFIKHDHPRSLRDRLKSLWRSKVKVEFDAGVALAKAKVPCVPVVAWGSHGSQGWLVTRQVTGAVKFWRAWRWCAKHEDRRKLFIDGWVRLLRRLRKAGVVHSDLHRGNILVKWRRGRLRFLLVDLYDARIAPAENAARITGAMSSLGPMVRLLRVSELDRLFSALGIGTWTANAEQIWKDILAPTTRRFKRHRGKRTDKQLAAGKLCRSAANEDGQWLIRRPFALSLASAAVAEFQRVSPGDASGWKRVVVEGRRLVIHRLRGHTAARWLSAYTVFGPGVQVARHLAWLKPNQGPHYVVWEDLRGPTLTEYLIADPQDSRRKLAEVGAALARLHDVEVAFSEGLTTQLSSDQVVVLDQPPNPLHSIALLYAEPIDKPPIHSHLDPRCAEDLAALMRSMPQGVGHLAKARLLAGYRRAARLKREQMRKLTTRRSD